MKHRKTEREPMRAVVEACKRVVEEGIYVPPKFRRRVRVHGRRPK